jgi:hypothetical protein
MKEKLFLVIWKKYLILYYHVFKLDFEKKQAWRIGFKDLCENGTHVISDDGSPNLSFLGRLLHKAQFSYKPNDLK